MYDRGQLTLKVMTDDMYRDLVLLDVVIVHIVAEGYEGAKKFPGQTNGGDF